MMNAIAARRAMICAGLVLAANLGIAQSPLRVCQWNVTNYTTTTGPARRTAFQTAFYGVFETRQLAPDIIAGQEFINAAAADDFVFMLNNAPGSPGDWVRGPFVDGADTEGVFFYRTSRVQFLGQTTVATGSSSSTNQPRNTYRGDFAPVGYLNNRESSILSIYNSHMKAGSTASDVARRVVECNNIVANANPFLTTGRNFLLCADLNQQDSNQDNYKILVGSNPAAPTGPFYDPIFRPGTWENNSAFANIHTQEPSTQMDSRHDQILISRNLWNNAGLDYIGSPTIPFKSWVSNDPQKWNDPNHSYRCWGNDGNTFNTVLATTGNTMVGPTIAQALITTVSGGGHLPVYIDMRVPAKMSVDTTFIDFGLVDLNQAVSANFTVSHAGNTALWGTSGLASLNYTLASTTGATVTTTAQSLSPAGSRVHSVSLNTLTSGVKTGTITVTSDDPDTPTRTIQWQAVVVGKFSGTRPGPKRP